jgi:Holliday junction DNA helicase RuvA
VIARLKGLVDEIGTDWLVLDVAGVGYLVFCSARTARAMPGLGEAVVLYIETHVREDHIHLYGFAEAREREAFRLLTTVQGVGAKVALAILGALSPDELVNAIVAQDKAPLTRADGVGPRLAARLLTELKDKIVTLGAPLAGVAPVNGAAPVAAPAAAGAGGTADDGIAADAVSALVNLGYGRADAFGAVTRAAQAQAGRATLETLIPAALKEVAG